MKPLKAIIPDDLVTIPDRPLSRQQGRALGTACWHIVRSALGLPPVRPRFSVALVGGTASSMRGGAARLGDHVRVGDRAVLMDMLCGTDLAPGDHVRPRLDAFAALVKKHRPKEFACLALPPRCDWAWTLTCAGETFSLRAVHAYVLDDGSISNVWHTRFDVLCAGGRR